MPENADWSWTFASPAAAAELGPRPELLIQTAAPVKASPVRKVFRAGEFYLKLDPRQGNRLSREWDSATLLAARHIPMVEHLALGRSSRGQLLITRALPDAVQAGVYFFRNCLREGVCRSSCRICAADHQLRTFSSGFSLRQRALSAGTA